jgi:allantoate deiminase
VEVIGFGDEEGSRFPAAMLCSRAVAGTLSTEALDLVDGDGIALANAGVDATAYLTAARDPSDVLAYFEAHIEQGPLLEAENLAVGTVTGIASQLRYQIEVRGTAGHAGTATMGLRRDALAGTAEMILAAETIGRAEASDLVATVGRVEVLPGAPNVIAGEARFSLDVRSGEVVRRDRATEAILDAFQKIADRRGLGLATKRVHDLPASPCDPLLMDLLDAAAAAADQPIRRLVSGAGHDAMAMAALCPTAMLFIRCRGGVSHNPAEHVDPADAEIALQVMLGFIDRLGATIGQT